MNTKLFFILVFSIISIQGMAQEQKFQVALAGEVNSDSTKIKSKEVKKNDSDGVAYSWYIRDAKFVDYFFKKEQAYFTTGVASGFSVNYKKSMVSLGAFIADGNYSGCFLVAGQTLNVKRLDGNWLGLTALIGEITYFPAQKSNAELWIYSAGIAYAFIYPMKWGTIMIGFMADGAYADPDIYLNTRMMLDLAIPIFN